MDTNKRKHNGNSILRAVLVALSLLFQIGWLLLLILRLNTYSTVISMVTGLLALVVVLRLYSKYTTSAMKMPWIMLILVFPVMGLSLYVLIEVFGDLGHMKKRIAQSRTETVMQLKQEDALLARLESQDMAMANISRYLSRHAHSPVYANTSAVHFAQATEAFEAMKRDLEQAQSFIFMEYFIVADGSAFQELEEILVRKARQGVDVRLMYDDIGSIGYVNFQFAKKLNQEGIHCQVFNPALPVLNLFMNHRDHRKIAVIDGKVGYTGGYNLADEYFDRKFPYGKWKDTGLRLEGEAVRSLTAAFLEMWCASNGSKEAMKPYLDIQSSVPQAEGFAQPYLDDPLEGERVAENVYLNLINSAQKSLYFITPYLIITDELNRALGLAAKRGVDVRIITPGIPDKKTVYGMTRSYYAGLARQGVRIYEFSPGFCHAKQCLCDRKAASVGTSNLDYRSLYLHFENNVLLIGGKAVEQIAKDFEDTFPQCREVTERYRTGRTAILRTWQCILRLFAPLM